MHLHILSNGNINMIKLKNLFLCIETYLTLKTMKKVFVKDINLHMLLQVEFVPWKSKIISTYINSKHNFLPKYGNDMFMIVHASMR